MKSGVGNHLLGLTSTTSKAALGISEAPAEQNRLNSKLHFLKSTKHLIDTIDARRFAAKEVTLIYLSFTNIRISIALPGGGVSLEGGANGTCARR